MEPSSGPLAGAAFAMAVDPGEPDEDDRACEAAGYTSLLRPTGAGAPKRKKKKPVLVLDPGEWERAKSSLAQTAASDFASATRSTRTASFSGFSGMAAEEIVETPAAGNGAAGSWTPYEYGAMPGFAQPDEESLDENAPLDAGQAPAPPEAAAPPPPAAAAPVEEQAIFTAPVPPRREPPPLDSRASIVETQFDEEDAREYWAPPVAEPVAAEPAPRPARVAGEDGAAHALRSRIPLEDAEDEVPAGIFARLAAWLRGLFG